MDNSTTITAPGESLSVRMGERRTDCKLRSFFLVSNVQSPPHAPASLHSTHTTIEEREAKEAVESTTTIEKNAPVDPMAATAFNGSSLAPSRTDDDSD